jgi:DNA-binding NtrC family response regulator
MPTCRLLIVDDEPALAGLLKRFLERSGYEVDACAGAEEALACAHRAKEAGAPHALVVTDLTLDGMNGEELVDRLRERLPDLPAIIASGYPHVPRSAGVEFLQKPFLPKMLVELLEKHLGPRESAS